MEEYLGHPKPEVPCSKRFKPNQKEREFNSMLLTGKIASINLQTIVCIGICIMSSCCPLVHPGVERQIKQHVILTVS
jgi:hypothetical protein